MLYWLGNYYRILSFKTLGHFLSLKNRRVANILPVRHYQVWKKKRVHLPVRMQRALCFKTSRTMIIGQSQRLDKTLWIVLNNTIITHWPVLHLVTPLVLLSVHSWVTRSAKQLLTAPLLIIAVASRPAKSILDALEALPEAYLFVIGADFTVNTFVSTVAIALATLIESRSIWGCESRFSKCMILNRL